MVRVKVVEQRQIFVQTCPPPVVCPKGNLLRDPMLEQWIGNTPLLWGATNVFRPEGRTGFGAGLGFDPTLPAAIFQTVTKGILPGLHYRLCFYARKLQQLGGNCDFTLEAQVIFFDANHNLIDSQSQSWADEQVPNTFRQFCVNVGPVHEGITYALVRIAMQVPVGVTPPNNCQVVVDDVVLECVSPR